MESSSLETSLGGTGGDAIVSSQRSVVDLGRILVLGTSWLMEFQHTVTPVTWIPMMASSRYFSIVVSVLGLGPGRLGVGGFVTLPGAIVVFDEVDCDDSLVLMSALCGVCQRRECLCYREEYR